MAGDIDDLTRNAPAAELRDPQGEHARAESVDASAADAQGPNYRILRIENRKTAAWQVMVGRRPHRITRTFSDDAYGGREAARAVAVEYRDAALPIMAPWDHAPTDRRNAQGGMTGVFPCHDRNNKLYGYEATASVKSEIRRRIFSFSEYKPGDALRRAEAQRETWLAEKTLAMIAEHAPAVTALIEQNAKLSSGDYLRLLQERDRDAELAALDARFQERRLPVAQTLSVFVRPYPDARLSLVVSLSGVAGRRQTLVSYLRQSLDSALGKLCAKAQTYVQDLAGRDAATRFMQDHADKFREAAFDRENGLSIREPISPRGYPLGADV